MLSKQSSPDKQNSPGKQRSPGTPLSPRALERFGKEEVRDQFDDRIPTKGQARAVAERIWEAEVRQRMEQAGVDPQNYNIDLYNMKVTKKKKKRSEK